MKTKPATDLTQGQAAALRRRLEAMRLQEIEGNPLDEDDIAMFEMFEREGLVPRALPSLYHRPRERWTSL